MVEADTKISHPSSGKFDIAADINKLYVYLDDELKGEYRTEPISSLLWDEHTDRIVVLVNHGNQIILYSIEKDSLVIERDLVLEVGYQIESFSAMWQTSTLLVYDRLRSVLNVYNIDKRQDMGYIAVDTANSQVVVGSGSVFGAIAVHYDKQLNTVSRFCNWYTFHESGRIVLLNSVSLPVGFYTYRIVVADRSLEQELETTPYCIVMTALSNDRSLVYFMVPGATVPYKIHTCEYHNGTFPALGHESLDLNSQCLRIKTNQEPAIVPFFDESRHILSAIKEKAEIPRQQQAP